MFCFILFSSLFYYFLYCKKYYLFKVGWTLSAIIYFNFFRLKFILVTVYYWSFRSVTQMICSVLLLSIPSFSIPFYSHLILFCILLFFVAVTLLCSAVFSLFLLWLIHSVLFRLFILFWPYNVIFFPIFYAVTLVIYFF